MKSYLYLPKKMDRMKVRALPFVACPGRAMCTAAMTKGIPNMHATDFYRLHYAAAHGYLKKVINGEVSIADQGRYIGFALSEVKLAREAIADEGNGQGRV